MGSESVNIAEKMVCPLVAPGLAMLIAWTKNDVSHEVSGKDVLETNKVFTQRSFSHSMIVGIELLRSGSF